VIAMPMNDAMDNAWGAEMSNDKRDDLVSKAEEWVEPEKGSALHVMKRVVQLGILAVSIVAAIPTLINLYHSYTQGVPFERVNHLLAQQKMWQTQGACMPEIKFDELTTGQKTKVFVGACPQSGDILFRLVSNNGQINHEWFPLKNFEVASETGFSLIDWLVSRAKASERSSDGRIRLAQASTFSVVCQVMQPENTMVRIVKEGSVCYRETMSLFTGAVSGREQVPCNSSCPAPANG